MDDCDDYSDYDDYDSDGDVFDEEDEFDDDDNGGEEDLEEEEEEEEEGEEEEEEDHEEEVEDAEDEMEDYEEEEEISENGEQHDDDEEIVEDQGVVFEYEAEEDLLEQEEEEEEELMEEEEEEEEELIEEEEEEEELLEEDEEDGEGDEDSYEDETDYEDEIAAAEPLYVPRQAPFQAIRAGFSGPRPRTVEIGLLDLIGDGRGLGSSGSDWRRNESGSGTASSRPSDDNVTSSDGNVVESRGTESSGSNESSGAGFQGAICPICFESWTGEGKHCVCCLPCGHLYGLSCIKMWLQRSDTQKCPQCNEACQLADVRRLYGMQPAITGLEELQQKVKCLEAKCASLELKDADWLRKETEWQKREADLQEQLNQHKEAGLVNDVIPGDAWERRDPADDPEPTNALRQMKL